MRPTLRLCAVASGAVLSIIGGPVHAAPGLDVYAQSAGGQSVVGAAGGLSCATFLADPRSAGFNGSLRVGLPTDGSICGVSTDAQAQVAPAGPIFASASVNRGFGTSGDPRSFVGTAAGRSGYGDLGVRADASYAGTSDAFVVSGSGAGALQTEVFTFGGALGAGTFRPTFTLDGDLFTLGRTDNQIVFSYAIGSGPLLTALRIQDSRGALSLYTPNGYASALPGMTVSGNNTIGQRVAGSTSFQLDVPIVFGAPLELTYALWAGVLPSSSVGQAATSAGDASFYSSLRLTGIALFDTSGQALATIDVTGASDTRYGAAGVVPEPASALLFALGLCGLLLALRHKPAPR